MHVVLFGVQMVQIFSIKHIGLQRKFVSVSEEVVSLFCARVASYELNLLLSIDALLPLADRILLSMIYPLL